MNNTFTEWPKYLPLALSGSFIAGSSYNLGYFLVIGFDLIQFISYKSVIITTLYFLSLLIIMLLFEWLVLRLYFKITLSSRGAFRNSFAARNSGIISAKRARLYIRVVPLLFLTVFVAASFVSYNIFSYLLAFFSMLFIVTYLNLHEFAFRERLIARALTWPGILFTVVIVFCFGLLAASQDLKDDITGMIRVDATMTHGKMLRHFDGYTVVRFNSMPFIGVIDSDGRLVLRQDPNSLTNNIFGREAAFYQIGSFFSSKNGREAEGD